MVDVNTQVVFNVRGKQILAELETKNKLAALNATVNGLAIDGSELILGAQDPVIRLTSLKGEFNSDLTGIQVDFGKTGLTQNAVSLEEPNIVKLETTGTVSEGLITISVNPESLVAGEMIGAAQVGALYDLKKEAENIAWALEQATANQIPTTPQGLEVAVLDDTAYFKWQPAGGKTSLEYVVTIKGADKTWRLRTSKLADYMDKLPDGEFTANIYALDRNGFESAVSADVDFRIDTIKDAKITATTTLVEGSVQGEVVITLEGSVWTGTDVVIEGLENPTATVADNVLTLNYAGILGLTAGAKKVTVPAEMISDGIPAETEIEVGPAPTIAVSGLVEDNIGGTLTLTLTGAEFADDVTMITAPCGENVPEITKNGADVVLTYTNAKDGEIVITIPAEAVKQAVAFTETFTVVDIPVFPTVTASYDNSTAWDAGKEYDVELIMDQGDFGGNHYTFQWNNFDATQWAKVELKNKATGAYVDITAQLANNNGELGQTMDVWTASQYVRVTPAYIADGEPTRVVDCNLVVTNVEGNWPPVEVLVSVTVNNAEIVE